MERYTVIGAAANFNTGILELTPEQFRSRTHCLKALGNGLYEIMTPVQFKAGEVVGFDGQPCKTLFEMISPQEDIPISETAPEDPVIEEITQRGRKRRR